MRYLACAVSCCSAGAFTLCNGIGTASKASAQRYQRYQLELETERKRLRAATPATISVRTR